MLLKRFFNVFQTIALLHKEGLVEFINIRHLQEGSVVIETAVFHLFGFHQYADAYHLCCKLLHEIDDTVMEPPALRKSSTTSTFDPSFRVRFDRTIVSILRVEPET